MITGVFPQESLLRLQELLVNIDRVERICRGARSVQEGFSQIRE